MLGIAIATGEINMCVGSTPKAPAAPPRLPEAPTAPDQTGVSQADLDKRRRAAAAGGGTTSTILTGPRGVQNGAQTAQKTLLGQ